jgi:aspartyl-tRNA(Asn)/glutamyl-tRNA(Gln) amidotransferase subunit B
MNSFRFLEKALEFEALRQEEVLRSGGVIEQQTYLWDPSTNRSIPMRSKEDAHDYRYFPEPDLLPLEIGSATIDSLAKTIPELPKKRKKRFEQEYGLPVSASEVLTSTCDVADYFENTLHFFNDARQVANWIMSDVLRIINELKTGVSNIHITPERLGALLLLIANGTVSAKAAKKVLDTIQKENREPGELIDELGLRQISDAGSLEAAVKKVLDESPSEVQRYRAGEKKLTGFFVGQVMKATKGSGNPKEINVILTKYLN